MLFTNEKQEHYFIKNEYIEKNNLFMEKINCGLTDFKNEANFPSLMLENTNFKIYDETRIQFLNNKNKNNNKEKKKHDKFDNDNLKRKCKKIVIENIIKFINNKIFEVYKGNIGKGFIQKKLMKLNQFQIANGDVEFNKIFITKTLKEILSENITKRIQSYDPDHNKKVIEEIISEKKEIFEKLFSLTFIECVEHFIGNKQIEELNGLTLFSELKEQILKKYEEEGESYYENLKCYLIKKKKMINKSKPRRKRSQIISNSE